ncbi:hypothetical protein MY5147_009672, partial [Beauveria neobassiana]
MASSETSRTALRAQSLTLAIVTRAVMGTIVNFVIPYLIDLDENSLTGKDGFLFGRLRPLAPIGSHLLISELRDHTFYEIAAILTREMKDLIKLTTETGGFKHLVTWSTPFLNGRVYALDLVPDD